MDAIPPDTALELILPPAGKRRRPVHGELFGKVTHAEPAGDTGKPPHLLFVIALRPHTWQAVERYWLSSAPKTDGARHAVVELSHPAGLPLPSRRQRGEELRVVRPQHEVDTAEVR